MKAVAIDRGGKAEELVGRVLCHDIRDRSQHIVFRKGHALGADDVPVLMEGSLEEIHLLELGADDVGQRQAGERLARILSSAGAQSAPAGHRHVLKAVHKGLLRIDVAALQRLNSIAGIAVFTLRDDHVVSADQVVAEAQITGLAIERRFIDAVEEIVRESAGVLRVRPFVPRDAIVWMRDDRLHRELTDKLRWFDCRVREIVDLPRDASSIRQAMEQRGESGATLFLVSGSNALDPLDPIFSALDEMGATMHRLGLPVHPGTLLWIASRESITILGLPTCGLGAQLTAFDLILPRLLAEGGIRDEDLAGLGHGGILR